MAVMARSNHNSINIVRAHHRVHIRGGVFKTSLFAFDNSGDAAARDSRFKRCACGLQARRCDAASKTAYANQRDGGGLFFR